NLMVLDGSIIPVSIGPNPALTITAGAERAVEVVVGQFAEAGDIRTGGEQGGSKPSRADRVRARCRGRRPESGAAGPARRSARFHRRAPGRARWLWAQDR